MKTISLVRRLLLAATVLGLVVTFAHAGPGPQYWTTLRSQSEFLQLKAEDRVVFVCKECQSVTEFSITSPEQAAELCKDGATAPCPACKAVTKVVLKRQRNDPPVRTVVTYVNDKGEECAFIAKAPVRREN